MLTKRSKLLIMLLCITVRSQVGLYVFKCRSDARVWMELRNWVVCIYWSTLDIAYDDPMILSFCKQDWQMSWVRLFSKCWPVIATSVQYQVEIRKKMKSDFPPRKIFFLEEIIGNFTGRFLRGFLARAISTPEYLKYRFKSMPRRMQAVVDAQGGHTKFWTLVGLCFAFTLSINQFYTRCR